MTATNVPAHSRADQPFPNAPAPAGFTQVVGSRWAELCRRHRLSIGARALLTELLYAADRRTESVNYYTQDGWAEVLGVHRNSVRKMQRELEQAGCIVVAKVPKACHYSVLITCWSEVVHQPRGATSAHIVSTPSTHPVQGVQNPSAQVQGKHTPRVREIEKAPDRVSGNSSSASPSRPLVDLVLDVLPRTNRSEAERWVGERIGAGCSTEQLQLALEDARMAGNVHYLSWVDKRLSRYVAERVSSHPADRPTEPWYCVPCYERGGDPVPVGACGCPTADVLELHRSAS